MDKLDRDLIDKLRLDSTQSNADLGRMLGVSEETARRRLMRLVNDGVIRRTVEVNHAELGYPVCLAMIFEVVPLGTEANAFKVLQGFADEMGEFLIYSGTSVFVAGENLRVEIAMREFDWSVLSEFIDKSAGYMMEFDRIEMVVRLL